MGCPTHLGTSPLPPSGADPSPFSDELRSLYDSRVLGPSVQMNQPISVIEKSAPIDKFPRTISSTRFGTSSSHPPPPPLKPRSAPLLFGKGQTINKINISNTTKSRLLDCCSGCINEGKNRQATSTQ